MALTDDNVVERLTLWAARCYGAGATIEGVERMPGNAGISFGFDVVSDRRRDRLVIRVPPPGVRRQGNTDVLRQAPLLPAAWAAGVPVPAVRWAEADERWFGVPYLIVERLAGRSPDRWNTGALGTPAMAASMFHQAVEALVATHAIAWSTELVGWMEPRSLVAEIEAWIPALHKAPKHDWVSPGLALRDALHKTLPPEPAPGVVHGDFYPNNWIFDDGRLTGIVDWEIAAIGPSLVDLGWLCMMQDPANWATSQTAPADWGGTPEDIAAMYEAAAGRPIEDLNWYRALAAWRFGAIIALNVRLHRTGRRHDPMWEHMADSFETLIDHGRRLLDA